MMTLLQRAEVSAHAITGQQLDLLRDEYQSKLGELVRRKEALDAIERQIESRKVELDAAARKQEEALLENNKSLVIAESNLKSLEQVRTRCIVDHAYVLLFHVGRICKTVNLVCAVWKRSSQKH